MRPLLLSLGALFWALLAVAASNENTDEDDEAIIVGLEALKAFVKIFDSEIFANTPVKGVAEMVGKVLSIPIALLNLDASCRKRDTPELKHLKKAFLEVNTKLEGISLQLDDVKKLIKWESIRVMYARNEHDILSVSEQFDQYLNASADERGNRERRFLTEFESQRGSTLHLYQAIVGSDFVIAENLAAAAVHYTGNNRRQVMDFLLSLTRRIMRGAELEIAYERLKHGFNASKLQEGDWKERMRQLVDKIHQVENVVKDAWLSQTGRDTDRFLMEKKSLGNTEFAELLWNFLAVKYDWRNWLVLAFPESAGQATRGAGYVLHLNNQGRTLSVGSSEKKASMFSEGYSDLVLRTAQTYGPATREARDRQDAIVEILMREQGNRWMEFTTFVATVICDCTIGIKFEPGHLAHRQTSVEVPHRGTFNTTYKLVTFDVFMFG